MADIWESMVAALEKDPSFRNMFRHMATYGNETAAELTQKDGSLAVRSYNEYNRMAGMVCGNMQRSGKFKAGDTVGLIYDTCMDWPVLFWGILMAGGTPLLLNPAMDKKQLKAIMKEAGANSYVAEKSMTKEGKNFISVEALLAPGRKGREVWADTMMLCTSGTTGSSRVFLYDGKTIASQFLSWKSAYKQNIDLPFEPGTVCKQLVFLPFYHVFGFSAVYLLYSLLGRIMVYLPDRSIRTVFAACKRHQVTHFFCVPMFFNAMAAGIRHQVPDTSILPEAIKVQIQENLLGSQIRALICGGGHLPAETLKVINEIGYPFLNGFGMTECGVISFEFSRDPKVRMKGSMGTLFPAVEHKLVPEGQGELYIRGDVLYTASMVNGEAVPRDETEWFATGDIMREDSEGRLYMAGRNKEVIINASGENIYPDLLEEHFLGLPGVAKSCILGIKMGVYEEVTLMVEKAKDLFDPEALKKVVKQINSKLPANEKVMHLYVSENELPLSGQMKIRRIQLKQLIEEGNWKYEEIDILDTDFPQPEKKQETLDVEEVISSLAEIKEEVRNTVSEMFSVDKDKITDDTHFIRDLSGDSLTVFSAINALEEHYGLVFSDTEIESMTTVDNAARVIFAKLNGVDEAKLNERPVEMKTHRITDFRNSAEYISLFKRKDELFDDVENPYFLPHDSLISDTSVIRGERVINLGSYNYLGLSGDPETQEAAIEAIRQYGTSASGSRTLAGEKTLYQQLEAAIAAWKHTEDAIVCTGGWATNLTFISSFMTEGDFILYDALSHNSIAEGVALSKAESKAFPHNNLSVLESLLIKIKGKYNKVLIVIEGVYSMDGDIAPVTEFVRLKKQYGCFLMVDEAHSGGVIGDNGGGVDDYFHLEPKDIDIKYGTLSKALGTCGGYIAADKAIVEYLRYSMSGFVFSAGIAPPLAAACMKSIEIIQRDNTRVQQLHRNIEYFVRRCKEEGMDTCLAGESAIVPVLIGSDKDAARLSAEMIKRGVFVPPAMYPAVPKGQSRLRFTVSSTHSIEQLEKAVSELSKLMRAEGFLPNETEENE